MDVTNLIGLGSILVIIGMFLVYPIVFKEVKKLLGLNSKNERVANLVNRPLFLDLASVLVSGGYITETEVEENLKKNPTLAKVVKFISEHQSKKREAADDAFPTLASYLTICEIFCSFFPETTIKKINEELSNRVGLKSSSDFSTVRNTVKVLNLFKNRKYASLFEFIDPDLRNAIGHANWEVKGNKIVYGIVDKRNKTEVKTAITLVEMGQKNFKAICSVVILLYAYKEALK